jgi:PAS domain S-box-containing protein
LPANDVMQLLRDLRLHQLELETQNRELIEMHQLLEESRGRYVELYDCAPVGYVTLGRSGLIEEINLAGARLLGAERAKLIGRPFRLFLTRTSRRSFDDHLRQWFAQQGRVVTEARLEHGDAIIELTSGPDPALAATPISCHTVLTDISDRKRGELERAEVLAREREARAEAERAIRGREDLLSVVSHELRTPLAPMMMWLGVLRGSAAAAADGLERRAIETLEMCVKAQCNLIEDLMDLARSRNGKQRIQREPVYLESVIEAVIGALGPTSAAKRIEVRVINEAAERPDAPAELPPVLGDVRRLHQVVTNLLSNAIKFTPEGGLVVVRLRQERDQRDQVLVVEDNGEGIDPAVLPHVFEPFRQQDSSSVRRHGGLGLGLSIVHELVALHGGTVHAASAGVGQGARFTITLPALDRGERPASNTRAVATRASEGTGEDASPLAGLLLLVVEDELQSRQAMSAALQRLGAQVIAAASAQEGRDALLRARPDAVLCDIAMPGEDGHSFVRDLRRREHEQGQGTHLPIVAITAHVGEQHRRKALASGFDLHLAKPIDLDQLLSAVTSLVKRPGSASPS